MEFLYGDLADNPIVGSFEPFTIEQDVVLEKAEYFTGVSKAGTEYESLDLIFIKNMGDHVKKYTEKILPLRKWENQTEEDFLQSVRNFNARIKHICNKLGVTDQEIIEKRTVNFSEFAKHVANLINQKNDGRKLLVKFVADKNNKTKLPPFPPFIEIMGAGELKFTDWEIKEKNKRNAIENINTLYEDTDLDFLA